MIDTLSSIIVLGIAIAIAVPFILIKLKKKHKLQKLENEFNALSGKENLVLSQKELWNNCYGIGFDSNSRKLLYFKKRNNETEKLVINLSEVETCRMVVIDKTSRAQVDRNYFSDRLELIFTFLKPGAPEKAIEFYDNKEFMPSESDLHYAKTWLEIVNSNIKSKIQQL